MVIGGNKGTTCKMPREYVVESKCWGGVADIAETLIRRGASECLGPPGRTSQRR